MNLQLPKRAKKSKTGKVEDVKKSHAYIILNYSNVTPFKTDNGAVRCLYGCRDEDFTPETIRDHMRSAHVQDRLSVVAGQPNSVIKVDVKNLLCVICNTPVPGLDKLEDHLFSTHDLRFERGIRDIIVPFELTDGEHKCQMCDNIFPTFRLINKHMHVHFSYHTCQECNSGFMTKQHLKWHKEVHKRDGYECIVCGKIYDSLAKRRRHFESMHNNAEVHGCPLCGKRFKEYYLKARHLAKVHEALPDKFPCKQCNKTFTTKTNLNLHERRNHRMERNHKCSYCEKTFFLSARLREHITTHTGDKSFVCDVCTKAYGTRRSLTKHYKSHKLAMQLCATTSNILMNAEPICVLETGNNDAKTSSENNSEYRINEQIKSEQDMCASNSEKPCNFEIEPPCTVEIENVTEIDSENVTEIDSENIKIKIEPMFTAVEDYDL